MAKEMGIDSPLLMFGDEDDFDNTTQRTVRKKSVKRSVRRTTMLPPELSKTLNETFKDRRRSSRLEAIDLKFKNPLEVSRIIEMKIWEYSKNIKAYRFTYQFLKLTLLYLACFLLSEIVF